MQHSYPIRVYYEDTDLAGFVYYANYLKFIERARSEWVREMGIDQAAMKAEDGSVFAVSKVVAEYLTPGRYDDQLTVVTHIASATPARVVFGQKVLRGETLVFRADVTVVFLDGRGRPKRLPAVLSAAAKEAE